MLLMFWIDCAAAIFTFAQRGMSKGNILNQTISQQVVLKNVISWRPPWAAPFTRAAAKSGAAKIESWRHWNFHLLVWTIVQFANECLKFWSKVTCESVKGRIRAMQTVMFSFWPGRTCFPPSSVPGAPGTTSVSTERHPIGPEPIAHKGLTIKPHPLMWRAIWDLANWAKVLNTGWFCLNPKHNSEAVT